MLDIIVRPDMPVELHTLKARIRVPRTATPGQLERAMQTQGGIFIREVAKQGWQFRHEYGMKITGGPWPPVDPKDVPKARHHGPLPDGPHDRGLHTYDTSWRQEIQPIAIADEWEWDIKGFFEKRVFVAEVDDGN